MIKVNLFRIVFLDVILLTFPILIYLIYLSTNLNINVKSKGIYFELALISSFFLTYNYGVNDLKIIPILILNSIVILSYLEDRYILANILPIILIIAYSNEFNNMYILLIIYIIMGIVYIFKSKINDLIFIELFITVSSIAYSIWIFKYNNIYFNYYDIIFIITSYFFIVNIMWLMYNTGKNILQTYVTFKELQKEKQIRLSLFKITHEIKNPIAVCKCYLDMLNVKDEKQVSKYIPIIKSETERLLSLLQDFLLINKSNLDMDIMDFNMLMEDTIYKIKPLLNENNIKLNLDIIDDEVYINGDYNRLGQVLVNLLKNSIEAVSKKQNSKISISTKIRKNKYLVIIEDNGEGMTKDVLSKMREPFFTTKKRGSGLGVSLIYEIIEAHKGKVDYESEYGKGTRVMIQIPLYE